MNKKIISLLLFSSGMAVLVYVVGVVMVSGFSVDVGTNYVSQNYVPTSNSISEFDPSVFCLKDISSQEVSISGELLYEKNCVYCHTTNEAGELDLLSLSQISEKLGHDKVFDIVKNGRKEMPVYGFVLTDQEIEGIFRYLDELQKNSLQNTSRP